MIYRAIERQIDKTNDRRKLAKMGASIIFDERGLSQQQVKALIDRVQAKLATLLPPEEADVEIAVAKATNEMIARAEDKRK